jgi:hypothetical protein
LVQYSQRGRAEKAHKRFLRTYLPEASGTGPVLLENAKWSAAALRRKLLVIILDADSQQMAQSLIKEVKEPR